MRLITDDAQLRSHLPNVIATARGETPFIERLAPFLDLAEDWAKAAFTGESAFDAICGYADDNNVRTLCSRLVAAEALRRAIPSLDIVLTPNGFGVVSSTNVAPASTARVDRLAASAVSDRDDCVAALLPLLPGVDGWLSSERARWFGATLFPTLGIVDETGGADGSRWERYLGLRPRIIDVETVMAIDWLSPELMAALQSETLAGTLEGRRKSVADAARTQVVAVLRNSAFDSRRLADIVTFIRQDPESFPEWHASETAKLFSPTVFRNNKKAGGYFF